MEKEQTIASLLLEIQAATLKPFFKISDRDVMITIALKSKRSVLSRLCECDKADNKRDVITEVIKGKADSTILGFILLYTERYCPGLKTELISTIPLLDIVDSLLAVKTQNEFKYLGEYSNLTQRAANGEFSYLISRPEEDYIDLVLRAEDLCALILRGPSRSGKTKLVYKFADDYRNHQIIMISVNDLVSGTIYRGTMEQRTKDVLKEACDTGSVLFIDEIHSVFNVPQLADIIKPFISESRLKLIGATTEYELKWLNPKDPLLQRFTFIDLQPFSNKLCHQALKSHLEKKRLFHSSVDFNDSLLEAVYTVSIKLFPDQATEKGARIIDLSMARASKTSNQVTLKDIIIVASLLSGKDNEFIFNLL